MKTYEITLDEAVLEDLNKLKMKNLYKPDTWTMEQWIYELMLQGVAKLKSEMN